jgi:acetyltransferase-like isoleucine patch superfamily enzyme
MIKKIIKKMLYKEKASSDDYIKYLRKKGMTIGNHTVIYSPNSVVIDETRPFLIDIGNHVKITHGVVILTHGYDWSVLNVKYNDILGSSGKVKIGNNVFIGMKSIILKGVTIGNNVIIGAGSLVNKDIPDNVVVAGCPAKVICSIEEYHKKRKEQQKKEAVELAIEYYKKNKIWPSEQILREFIFLFEKRDSSIKNNATFSEIASINGNYSETLQLFLDSEGVFESYNSFIDYCKKELKKETK